jgi:sulfate transport system permease protein
MSAASSVRRFVEGRGEPRSRTRARGGARVSLPGVKIALGFTLAYLLVMVLLPIAGLLGKGGSVGARALVKAIASERVLAAFRLSFGTSLIAALVCGVFGLLVAWVLARYEFPGKRVVDALVDVPFALPTAVAGISLTTLYSENGWFGRWLERCGVRVAFTSLGITIALVFVGLPFAVRAAQPVLRDLEVELEEAAVSLGARPWQVLVRVSLPVVLPAWVSGIAQAFARAVGEYGSVVFISGNMPNKTEIVPLLVVAKLEQYDYAGATALGIAMMALSFVLLFALNMLESRASRRAVAE